MVRIYMYTQPIRGYSKEPFVTDAQASDARALASSALSHRTLTNPETHTFGRLNPRARADL